MDIKDMEGMKAGDYIHHKTLKNADNTPQRFKITSIKRLKRHPELILIGIKRGLYEYHKIHEFELDYFNKGYGDE